MYSGIVLGTVPIRSFDVVTDDNGTETSARLSIEWRDFVGDDLFLGASVSIDGICLTVTEFSDKEVFFDLSRETLLRTNILARRVGDLVNLERPLRQGVENGGHQISGHVDGKAWVVDVFRESDNYQVVFGVDYRLGRFLFNKGFVALNGVSLTATDLVRGGKSEETRFSVWLIPETLKRTNFPTLKEGDEVNLEIDRYTQVIVETVVSFMRSPEMFDDLDPA